MTPRIVFRADAAPGIGGGHVMRCLTLARALAGYGADCLFLVNPAALSMIPAERRGAARFEAVEPGAGAMLGALHDVWPEGADWVVFDHYGIDAAQEQTVRAACCRIAVIDDLADRPHDCDLLLDQTWGRAPDDYRALVPGGATLLLGTHYALLRPEFVRLRPAALARRRGAEVARVFVCFGLGEAIPAARAVRALNGTGCAIDVAVGHRAPGLEELRALTAADATVTLHLDTADVPALMAAADIAIGSGGTMSWERCCLGLPSVVRVLAPNQRLIAQNLAAEGAIALVGDNDRDLRPAFDALCTDASACEAMSARAAALCDGHGADRMARMMAEALERAA